MIDIFMRAGCFAAIIVLGYVLKKIGFFKEEDFTLISRITIRITLPAAIISSFSGMEIDTSLLMLFPVAFSCGALYVLLGFLLNRRKGRQWQAFEMLNLSGYNIGTFVLPFAQGFLGPIGVIATSVFDTGNAVICLGGAYSIASMVKNGSRFSIKRIAGLLVRSVPFMTYITMLAVNLLHVPIPGFVTSCAQIIGNANAFMAMLMIGVGFKLVGDAAQIGEMIRVLAIRYGMGVIWAMVFYFCLPFQLEIRQALVILALSPISSAATAFTGEMGSDVGLSSAINSMSIVISIFITVVLLTVML